MIAWSTFKELFNMPAEGKASFYSTEINKSCWLYTSNLSYETEEVHLWRDPLRHPCHPLQGHVQTRARKADQISVN